MPDHRRRLAVAERGDEAERVAHRVERVERAEVVVVIGAPAGGAAIAAQIGGDDVKAGSGERPHHLAPGIGELREPVQQQDAGPAGGLVPGFEDVDAQPVDPLDKTRADAGRQHGGIPRRKFDHGVPPRHGPNLRRIPRLRHPRLAPAVSMALRGDIRTGLNRSAITYIYVQSVAAQLLDREEPIDYYFVSLTNYFGEST